MPKTPYFYFIKQISRVRYNHPRALSQTKNCFSAIPQAPLRTEYHSPHSKKTLFFFVKILCGRRSLSLFCQNSLQPALKEDSLLFRQNSLRPAPALPFLSKFSAACAQKKPYFFFIKILCGRRSLSLFVKILCGSRSKKASLFFVKICPHPQTARGGPACSAEQEQTYYGAAVS